MAALKLIILVLVVCLGLLAGWGASASEEGMLAPDFESFVRSSRLPSTQPGFAASRTTQISRLHLRLLKTLSIESGLTYLDLNSKARYVCAHAGG